VEDGLNALWFYSICIFEALGSEVGAITVAVVWI